MHTKIGEYEFVVTHHETIEDMVEQHNSIKTAFSEKDGHNSREWNRVRKTYAATGKIELEDLEKCNKWQRLVINQMKLIFINEEE